VYGELLGLLKPGLRRFELGVIKGSRVRSLFLVDMKINFSGFNG
jgi:hypothetical protein